MPPAVATRVGSRQWRRNVAVPRARSRRRVSVVIAGMTGRLVRSNGSAMRRNGSSRHPTPSRGLSADVVWAAAPGELVAERLGNIELVEVGGQTEAHAAGRLRPLDVEQPVAGTILEQRRRVDVSHGRCVAVEPLAGGAERAQRL